MKLTFDKSERSPKGMLGGPTATEVDAIINVVEIDAPHPFDLLSGIGDLERFIHREMERYGRREFTVNDALRFGIGENAYAASGEAMAAKEKEPVVLLNLHNGFHVVSKDTVVFFLYRLLDRDGQLTVSDGERVKIVAGKTSRPALK